MSSSRLGKGPAPSSHCRFVPTGPQSADDREKVGGVATAAANLLSQTELLLVAANQIAPTPQVAMAVAAWPLFQTHAR